VPFKHFVRVTVTRDGDDQRLTRLSVCQQQTRLLEAVSLSDRTKPVYYATDAFIHMMSKGHLQSRARRVLLWTALCVAFALVPAMFILIDHGCQCSGEGQNRSTVRRYLRTAFAPDHQDPAACADGIQAYELLPQAQSYLPAELQRILVCITMQFTVS
jgi:hypothetical protein